MTRYISILNKLVVFLIIIIGIGCHSNKLPVKKSLQSVSSNFIQTDSFGIRIKPILNREYLTYLVWTVNIFGESYPEKITDILPKHLINNKLNNISDLEFVLSTSESLLTDYILNPKYVNYPLIGLDKQQVIEMEKWMCDRYNENMLIKLGYLNYNFDQKDEDNFVLEALIVGQYQGSSTGVNIPRWEEDFYLPNFRIPTSSEINIIQNRKEYSNELVEYSFNDDDFLWTWDEEYLTIDDNEILLHFNNAIRSTNTTQLDLSQYSLNEMILENQSLQFRALENLRLGYFGWCGYPEKNQLGRMQFIIVCSDKNNQPLIAEMINIQDEGSPKNEIARIAYTKKLNRILMGSY